MDKNVDQKPKEEDQPVAEREGVRVADAHYGIFKSFLFIFFICEFYDLRVNFFTCPLWI